MSSHRAQTLLILVSTVPLLLAGCRTTELPRPYTIDIPPGMTDQQVQVAVLAGILNTPPPPTYDPLEELPEEEFDRLLWKGFVADARSRSWFPEAREGPTIYASVDTRGHYLRAAITRRVDVIEIGIVESRNLEQSEGRIHKRAVTWLRNLEAHIRREVGRMSLVVRLGG